MQDYGSNAWRIYNQTLKTMFEEAEKQLEIISKNIQAINLTRKSEQTMAGERIHYLQHKLAHLLEQTKIPKIP
jgi:pre-mRNA-splicing factor SPF27